MTKNKDPTPLPTPKANSLQHAYDCTSCRFVDQHGLVCGVCLRKILDERATKNFDKEVS